MPASCSADKESKRPKLVEEFTRSENSVFVEVDSINM